MEHKKAVIIGAGPAGLTAAYELVTRAGIKPIVLEKSNEIGGLSRTVVYKGNRIDIGGHRFFSKSDIVMEWWRNILPIQGSLAKDELSLENSEIKANYLKKTYPDGPNPELADKVMLLRNRLSRIFFLGKFFDYPISINWNTISSLGVLKILKILWTYILVKCFPIKKVDTLEDFFISRFGSELYNTFFKDYTEKVWGVPCSKINSEWGAQRIKKLSITRTLSHALKGIFTKEKSITQKNVDTSLIEQFMYPKYGPGQMWETVAEIIKKNGGEIIFCADVNRIGFTDNLITEIGYANKNTGLEDKVQGHYFFSTMPIVNLIESFGNKVPQKVTDVSKGLQYRDFITVGLLLNKLSINNNKAKKMISDNWIYIQENEVKIGRLQIFNNWSPYLIEDSSKVWIGLEYFCNEGDELWSKTDEEFIKFAIDELHQIKIIDKEDVLDSTIIRSLKTYPAYFGTYSKFDIIRDYTDSFTNLFLIGRNGMHKYNNQDHSMLTAITAVNNIINGVTSKSNIWAVNVEEDYHEEQ